MADTTIPSSRNALVSFYVARAGDWIANAELLGLSPEAAQQVRAAALDAETKIAEAERLRLLAKTATEAANAAGRALRAIGGAATATIRAHAEMTGDRDLYDVAKVSPIAPASPTPAPSSPTNARAEPNADGSIALTWQGTIARSQWFQIERSIDGGPWAPIDTIRGKHWLDSAVPSGARHISYRIYGRRGNRRSTNPAQASVQFGTGAAQAERERSRAA